MVQLGPLKEVNVVRTAVVLYKPAYEPLAVALHLLLTHFRRALSVNTYDLLLYGLIITGVPSVNCARLPNVMTDKLRTLSHNTVRFISMH